MAVSPDGRQIAFSMLMPGEPAAICPCGPLDSLDLTPVPGSEARHSALLVPRRTADRVRRSCRGVLKKVDLAGGPGPDALQDAGRRPRGGAHLGPRGRDRLLRPAGSSFACRPAGGEPEPLGDARRGRDRAVLAAVPAGRPALPLRVRSRPPRKTRESTSEPSIRTSASASSRREYNAAYSPPGYLLFVKDEALVAQPFDARRLEALGRAVSRPRASWRSVHGHAAGGLAHFSVSANGVLAWRPGSPARAQQLTWFDRSGQEARDARRAWRLRPPCVLSPDEKSRGGLPGGLVQPNPRHLDPRRRARSTSRRLTFDPHDDCGPTWSPDGQPDRVLLRPPGRAGDLPEARRTARATTSSCSPPRTSALNLEDWSADGRFLVYNSPGPGATTTISSCFPCLRPAEREADPLPRDRGPRAHRARSLPNGRWIAYRSAEHGRRTRSTSRRSPPQGEAGPGEVADLDGGGLAPRWRRDGKELFYGTGTGIHSVQGDEPTAPASRRARPNGSSTRSSPRSRVRLLRYRETGSASCCSCRRSRASRSACS